ncbi:MAG: cytochrome C biogenesis protein [Legionella sp.]|nr:MAG: cytochrome C biogenesis protein [Legionella sp.]PJD99850.1 MAG: cytochrome C biogenesis protein [Legionella sp.]
MNKDYYAIMGVDPKASEQEIKTAYRRLARKYHPDISKEPNAEERFKEMGEAYETLKDPQKRAQYDMYLQQAQRPHQEPHFSQNFYQNQTAHQYSPEFDADFFETLFGHARSQRQEQSGQDYHGSIQITLEEALNGTVKSIQIPASNGQSHTTQTLKVKIPAGVKPGQKIRLTGQGAAHIPGGKKGDLYLTIELSKHPLFELKDDDLYLTLPVTPWEAALGATITVPTLSGKIELKIPKGSQGGQKLRIKNKGLGGTTGSLYVLLKIITPPPSTEEAKACYEQMAKIMPFNPRESLGV